MYQDSRECGSDFENFRTHFSHTLVLFHCSHHTFAAKTLDIFLLTMADPKQPAATAGAAKTFYYLLDPTLRRRTIIRNVRLGVREFQESATFANVTATLRSAVGQHYPTRAPNDDGPDEPSFELLDQQDADKESKTSDNEGRR